MGKMEEDGSVRIFQFGDLKVLFLKRRQNKRNVPLIDENEHRSRVNSKTFYCKSLSC